MTRRWFRSTRSQAFALLGLQSLLILAIAVILSLFKGLAVGCSLMLGGVVSIVPNLYFTHMLFRENRASAAKKIVKTFYHSEFIKLLMVVALFFLLMKWLPLSIIPFVVGFFIAQMGIWLAPILFMRESQ